MKKNVKNLYLIFTFLILISSSLVLAQSFPSGNGPLSTIGDFVESFFEFIKPLLEVILGTESPNSVATSSDFVVRILLFAIIFAIMWSVVTRIEFFNSYPAVEWIVTIAVSILSTRWLATSPELIQTVLLPYNAIGISMTAFLPLIIYFFFLEVGFKGRKNRVIRKAGWIFLAVVFTFLWFSRANEIGLDNTLNASGLMVYPISAGLCLLFSFMDRSIQSFFERAKVDRIAAGADRRLAISLMAQRRDIEKVLEGETNEHTVSRLRKQLDDIDKQLIKLESS